MVHARRAARDGPPTVPVQPWGTLKGRIVDEDGRPRGGLAMTGLGGTDPRSSLDLDIVPGSAISASLVIGRDGRCHIEGLVPGLEYGADAAPGACAWVKPSAT